MIFRMTGGILKGVGKLLLSVEYRYLLLQN